MSVDVANEPDLASLREMAGYMAPDRSWGARPQLQSSDRQTWRTKDTLAADARDSARTNPYGRSALRAQADAVIGTNFKLQYEPDYTQLGVSADEAAEYSAMVESVWETQANSIFCYFDAQRKQSFTGLMRMAYSSWFVDGEVLGTIEWKRGIGSNRTCLHFLEPERLCDPRDVIDYTGHRRMGVERDIHGAPLGYWLREANLSDVVVWGPWDKQWTWRYVPRYGPTGRQNVIHFYDHDRPDMTRGMTSYTTALLPMRLLQDYNMTELESAAVRATYAAVVESELDYDKAMKIIGADQASAIGSNRVLDFTLRMMAENAKYYRGQEFKFGKSKVAHLLPNEKLHMVQGNQSASALKDFNEQNLYMLASALGVDYATLTKNFSDTNYSGARAALFDVWRSYEVRRSTFIQHVPLPFFMAWLEERVALVQDIPMLGKKNFYEVRDAMCRATFQTWTKPRLDPLKENQADQVLYNMGAYSLRELCAADGRDWQAVLTQRALEKKKMQELGLKPEDIDWELQASKMKSQLKPSSNSGSGENS